MTQDQNQNEENKAIQEDEPDQFETSITIADDVSAENRVQDKDEE